MKKEPKFKAGDLVVFDHGPLVVPLYTNIKRGRLLLVLEIQEYHSVLYDLINKENRRIHSCWLRKVNAN